MKLLVLLFAMGICAQAQTARQLIGGSDSLTPGCVAQVAGSWNERQLSAANIFVPGTELGGFTVTVNGSACAVQAVGPDRLIFWMPVNAPVGDYSAVVDSPAGTRSIALHVVEASPTIHATPTGISGMYSPIAMPFPQPIGLDGILNLPSDGSSVFVLLFASGLNPAAQLERKVIVTRLADSVETHFPILGVRAPGGPHLVETMNFVMSSLPAGDYQIAISVGTEISQPASLTIHSNGLSFRPFRPAWLN